jgi:predicted nuclease with TOPRIM domain
MSDLNVMVSGIEFKVRKLTEMLELRETESAKWLNERSQLQKKIEEQRMQIQQLEERNNKLHMAHALTSKDDVVSVKQRINELVREVDRCLAMLNK